MKYDIKLLISICLQIFPGPDKKGWVFVMEHLDIRGLSKHQAALGEQLAMQVKRQQVSSVNQNSVCTLPT